ncbi:MAG: hypothetical protein A3K10_05385 [Bacteroidetes bacterium RIFCSPLOWO2_12_FULL_31_6]|nr:MAG: hypothetical protein A3K10_05385 [Bacteroidetes bacterium RIFCSPLOWO2_12_FULL_31_6]
MEPLIIQQTEDSPSVIFDHQKNIFKISGESRPENAGTFYLPILEWLDGYKKYMFWAKEEFSQTKKTVFEFSLEYFNSTSAKYLLDIMNALSSIKKEGIELTVHWHYDEIDEDMFDSGKELALMANIEIVFVKQ